MKVWMVATYKNNELKRLKDNLQNQDLEYYHPKISDYLKDLFDTFNKNI